MLTVEIKINGHLVSYIGAVNKGMFFPGGLDPEMEEILVAEINYQYAVEVFNPGKSGEEKGLHRFEIEHVRAQGAHELVRKILERYEEIRSRG